MPAITVEDVSKSFRQPVEARHTLKERVLHPFGGREQRSFAALKNVTFDVHEGEFFGIVGRNGSGKSTLLKCLAGIYGVDSGRIVASAGGWPRSSSSASASTPTSRRTTTSS